MGRQKKVNPRRVPATMADVKKAQTEVGGNAMRHALELVLFILVDKHGAPAEDVQALSCEITHFCSSITDGGLSWNYIHKILKENDVEVRLK